MLLQVLSTRLRRRAKPQIDQEARCAEDTHHDQSHSTNDHGTHGTSVKRAVTMANHNRQSGAPEGLTPGTWQRAQKHERELLGYIEVAHREKRSKKADFAARRYLQSFDARLVATVRAYRKMRKEQRPPAAEISSIAQALNLWEVCDENVYVYLKPKPHDPHDFRTIMAFGIRHRARQYLIGATLSARAELAPNQFFSRGGTHTAIRTASEAMKNGYRYATEIDISKCFDSFEPQAVTQLLPLPKEITQLTVLSHTYSLKAYPYDVHLADDFETSDDLRERLEYLGVQWGIPQGSAISSFVAEMLLAPAIAQLPDCGVAVAYADNVLLLAKSHDEMVTMTKSLQCALAAHPAGPLLPNPLKRYRPGDAVKFLGHQIAVESGTVRVSPSLENLCHFKSKFKRGVSGLLRHPRPCGMSELRKFVISWCAAFKLCDGVDEHRDHYLRQLADVKQRLQ